MLMVEESSREGLLGGIGVLFLLFALALLALAGLGGLVDGSKDLLCLVNGVPPGFHDRGSNSSYIIERGNLALFAAEDRSAMLAIVCQEVGNTVLDVDKTRLQVVERGNDLVMIVSF